MRDVENRDLEVNGNHDSGRWSSGSWSLHGFPPTKNEGAEVNRCNSMGKPRIRSRFFVNQVYFYVGVERDRLQALSGQCLSVSLKNVFVARTRFFK